MAFLHFVYLALISMNMGIAFAQSDDPVATTGQEPSTIVVPSITTASEAPSSSISPSSATATTVTQSISTALTTIISSSISTTVLPTTTPVPVPTGVQVKINPNGNVSKCLDVRGGIFANGTPVQIFDCNGTPAQNWILAPGRTKVVLAGTNFCLDAGSTPGNGVGMKIWQCFDNLPAQDWFYTFDQRIALTNQGVCLDLTNGDLTNTNLVQTWQCTNFDTNQIWTISL